MLKNWSKKDACRMVCLVWELLSLFGSETTGREKKTLVNSVMLCYPSGFQVRELIYIYIFLFSRVKMEVLS